jgi:hypothetical protein
LTKTLPAQTVRHRLSPASVGIVVVPDLLAFGAEARNLFMLDEDNDGFVEPANRATDDGRLAWGLLNIWRIVIHRRD